MSRRMKEGLRTLLITVLLVIAAVFFVEEIIMTLVTYNRHKDTFIESGSIYTGK